MLQSLYIQNYALINELKIDFQNGFSIITGETGAGKSILLGAFSLLVGSRADASILLDKSKKCIVEASFQIKPYKLQSFFKQNDIDYHDVVIIRREIDNSRSRSFINDSPVNLSLLKELGDRLIDVHSQHENLYLNHSSFRFEIIDALASNAKTLQNYQIVFAQFQQKQEELRALTERASKTKTDYDYYKFRFDELDQAKLKEGELQQLEQESQALSHAEEIRNNLQAFAFILSLDEASVNTRLKEASLLLHKIKSYYPKAGTLSERLESAYLELKDIAAEAESLSERVDLEPGKLDLVNARLNLIFSLCQKYHAANEKELLDERNKLEGLISDITGFDDQLNELSAQVTALKNQIAELAEKLTVSRKKACPEFESQILLLLKVLGMPNAAFTAKLETAENFSFYGKDKIEFLFSANRQVAPSDISKVASGGELSRLMLSIKSVIASSLALPSIIFDEIDTGVSGEIADKMGNIMRSMSKSMQVISITHLPQVASKGLNHYLVYKKDHSESTNTHIKLLNQEERINEIAKMLSGEKLTDAAIQNAKALLNYKD